MGTQKLKVGDTVQVMSGAERLQKQNRGKILEIDRPAARARVEGLRIVKKHVRKGRNKERPEGGIIEAPGTIALSNLALVCPKCSKPNRVGMRELKRESDGKIRHKRFCKGCNELVE